ncbi:MAG TPA: hypothetical protein VK936_08460 [Longimicrobiales bacterium]|nr:hypothetical protein [Longimicrobiales bacterium]
MTRPVVAGPAAWWGVLGVAFVFASAAFRLGERGVITMRAGLGPWEWAALAGLTAVFVYGEGVRALQRKYIPFVIRRVDAVRREHIVYRVLAPLHAMALVGAPPGILVRAWGGSLAIVAAVLIVRGFAEPWRGIVDFAVAAALSWGTVALIVLAARAARPIEPGASAG